MNHAALNLIQNIREDIFCDTKVLKKYGLSQNEYFATWFIIQGCYEYANMLDLVSINILEVGELANFREINNTNILTAFDISVWLIRGDLKEAFSFQSGESIYDFKIWKLLTLGSEPMILSCKEIEYFYKDEDVNIEKVKELFSRGSGKFKESDVIEKIMGNIITQKNVYTSIAKGRTQGFLSEFIDPTEFDGYQQISISPLPKVSNGVNVLGYSHNELGIGEDARTTFAAISLFKKTFLFPLKLPGRPTFSPAFSSLPIDSDLPGKINIFNLPIVDFSQQTLMWGSRFLESRYNIVFAPWEFAIWPRSKKFCFENVDEIWASSDFTAQAYLPFFDKAKVKKMPLPVVVNEKVEKDRKRFCLPEGADLFLYMFDFNSSLLRKNPEVLVNAFIEEFKEDLTKGLVLKFLNFSEDNEIFQSLSLKIKNQPNIYCVNETLSPNEVYTLIKCADFYVSPHRSEGFGRTLAESMLLKVPVIATPFSGNCEFCIPGTFIPLDYEVIKVKEGDYPLIDDSQGSFQWANVKKSSLKSAMRASLDADQCEMVNKAYNSIKSKYSLEACGKVYRDRINEVFKFLK